MRCTTKHRTRRWTYTRRTINGKRVRVKYHRKGNGKYLVRKVKIWNSHD